MDTIFNKFVTYALSPTEKNIGSTYNIYQLAMLQNRRAEIALALLNVKFDPEHPIAFAQEKAELQGQMGILDWQFELHQIAARELAENPELGESSQSQQSTGA